MTADPISADPISAGPSLPPVAAPYRLPFHYGALHNIGLDYLVDPAPARRLLAERHPELTAADFDGRACVTLNYQLYFAQYPTGGGITQEIEISVIAHPRTGAEHLARLTYEQFAHGWDQTRLLGIARLHVLCDNPLAIRAGTELYGEPKYPAWFEAAMPSLNGPPGENWSVTCGRAALDAAGDGIERGEQRLFSFEADLVGLTRTQVGNSPVTGYGVDGAGRPLAGPMHLHHPYQHHPLDAVTADRVRLRVHDTASACGTDLTTLIAGAPAAGAWTYQSAPVAAHHRPYYVPRSG